MKAITLKLQFSQHGLWILLTKFINHKPIDIILYGIFNNMTREDRCFSICFFFFFLLLWDAGNKIWDIKCIIRINVIKAGCVTKIISVTRYGICKISVQVDEVKKALIRIVPGRVSNEPRAWRWLVKRHWRHKSRKSLPGNRPLLCWDSGQSTRQNFNYLNANGYGDTRDTRHTRPRHIARLGFIAPLWPRAVLLFGPQRGSKGLTLPLAVTLHKPLLLSPFLITMRCFLSRSVLLRFRIFLRIQSPVAVQSY